MMLDMPTVLYKYFPAARLSDALPRDGRAKLRLSQPGALNDPWECIPPLVSSLATKSAEEMASVLTAITPDNPVDAETVDTLGRNVGVKLQQEYFLDQINKRWGIASFTTTPCNALMWSHYAEAGAGFVVGYDANVLKDLVPLNDGTLEAVIYEKQRAVVDSITELTSGGKQLTKVLLTKSADWQYEHEWRIVAPLSSAKRTGTKLPNRKGELELFLLDVPPDAVVKVYCTDEGLMVRAPRETCRSQEIVHYCRMFDLLHEALGDHVYRARTPVLLRRDLRTFDFVEKWN